MADREVRAIKIVDVRYLWVLGNKRGEVSFRYRRFLRGQIPEGLARHTYDVDLILRHIRRKDGHTKRWQACGKHHLRIIVNLARNTHQEFLRHFEGTLLSEEQG